MPYPHFIYNSNPITDFKVSYYDIKLSYPDIIMPYVEKKMPDPVISMTISNTMPYCDIILPYPTGLVILMVYRDVNYWYCRHLPPTPTF